MPINTSGGNVKIEGGYNDVAGDMHYYAGNTVPQGQPSSSSNNANARDFHKYNGQEIHNTTYGRNMYHSTDERTGKS
ncbi:hypothetical protein L208DRAFT_1385430 [Tricholoma matsutake]|nr:hypothetical protein L208DRAFT_1385430 [Tricholoma matsutake 945]